MDWDSPTTKKHIAEAKTQKCELLGPGKDANYRTYRLPCGHEQQTAVTSMRKSLPTCRTCIDARFKVEAKAQGCVLLDPGRTAMHRVYRLPCGHEREIQLNDMRKGSFRCQPCLDKRLVDEAKAQDCELLGQGSHFSRRTYRLSCGHELEIATSSMRNGGFACQTCIDNKRISEAEAQGCVLLGAGKNCDYRLYRLACGHEQAIHTSIMRTGGFRCQTCLQEKLSAEANALGCELLRPGRNKHYRIYRLPCGHEQEVVSGMMRTGSFRCQTCLNLNLEAEAKAQGCELLGPGRTAMQRTYRLPCGHEREYQTTLIRSGGFRCPTCLINKHHAEAEARGCVLLGPGRTVMYRTYRLECGHEQEITLNSMRLGNFLCHICEENFYTLPSQAYLMHIKVGPDEWLKLGFAKNLDFRVSQYGLPSEAVVSVLMTKPFSTGKEAQEFEKTLHNTYQRKRLKAAEMANFHTKSGQTECYPVIMVDQLIAAFRQNSTK